jgi:hypothetical protein
MGSIRRRPTPPTARPDGTRSLWGSIPPRNPHFTARRTEIETLHECFQHMERVASGRAPTQVLYGHAGVGKTEIAVEYAYRYRNNYDVVWWVRAEREDLVRGSLIELGRCLDLHDLYDLRDGDHLVRATLTALRPGVPHFRRLLVFDHAIGPDVLLRYLPAGNSVHVLVTTQSHGWRQALPEGVLDVLEFEQAETVEFLRRRVPCLAPVIAPVVAPAPDDRPPPGVRERDEEQRRKAEATLLAAVLDGLPLAAEQAAAYLNETQVSVDDYLDRFRRAGERVVNPDADSLTPDAVATCCAVAQDALSLEALALLRVLAMVFPEPVSGEILVQPSVLNRLPEELRGALSGDRPFRNASRELARYSLVRFDGARNETQIHGPVKAIVERGLI